MGGQLFETSITTLKKDPNSMLAEMFGIAKDQITILVLQSYTLTCYLLQKIKVVFTVMPTTLTLLIETGLTLG